VHTTSTWIRVGGVIDRTTYSVRVTADGTTATSTLRTAVPVANVPTSIASVSAAPAGPDRIRVTWKGGTQARSFAIIGGSDSMTTRNHFATGWHPAALQSWTVTIPARLHDVLGAGSGNPVFLKVALSNSAASDPVKHLTFSLADKYRLTPSGTWSLAGAPAVPASVTRFSVASWNVQSVTATKTFTTKDQWAARISRVVANIESLRPDLIGMQELTTARIDPARCHNSPARGDYHCAEQYTTLQEALGTATAAVPTVYRNAREDAKVWLYSQPANTYVDSALFYNPARLTVLDAGFVSPRTIMGQAWPSDVSDETGMWAEFRSIATPSRPQRIFYAVSIHLPAGADSATSALRRAEATAIGAWIDAKAGTVPVVITGDLNANGATDADAGSLRLRALGYTDAAATADRGGSFYSSDNATNGTDGPDEGYPVTAVRHPYPTSRIDYILVKGSPFTYRYRNEVRLTPGTSRFDPRYQGSDHNMQLAIIGITASGSGS
jgi:endonuclease/exonuclease/phosphatase family metal-dependent hydrolase